MTYWEWDELSGMHERRKYLEGKLQCNVSVDSAAQSRQAPGRPRASTQARDGAAASGGGASESVHLSESNQDEWKERSRAPTAFSETYKGIVGADTGKEGYLNESATHSPEGWAVAKTKGKRRGKMSAQD